MQLGFGAGVLYGERTDTTGSGIGPMPFGVLQSASFDFDFTTKQLYGARQFPIAIARSNARITGRGMFARVNGNLWSDLAFGTTAATGKVAVAIDEAGSVPATSTYTVTVSNAANFLNDLGVKDATSDQIYTRVTTPSAAYEYSVNESTGVYTFAAASASAAVKITYEWNVTASGKKISLTNPLMGVTPTFRLTFNMPISPGPPGSGGQSLPTTMIFNACTSSKLSIPTRVDDWMIQELDLEAFADASGNIGTISTNE